MKQVLLTAGTLAVLTLSAFGFDGNNDSKDKKSNCCVQKKECCDVKDKDCCLDASKSGKATEKGENSTAHCAPKGK